MPITPSYIKHPVFPYSTPTDRASEISQPQHPLSVNGQTHMAAMAPTNPDGKQLFVNWQSLI